MKPDIVRRYGHNPILTKAEIPYPVETVHNAAVVASLNLKKTTDRGLRTTLHTVETFFYMSFPGLK